MWVSERPSDESIMKYYDSLTEDQKREAFLHLIWDECKNDEVYINKRGEIAWTAGDSPIHLE